jgi:hypothetical protein
MDQAPRGAWEYSRDPLSGLDRPLSCGNSGKRRNAQSIGWLGRITNRSTRGGAGVPPCPCRGVPACLPRLCPPTRPVPHTHTHNPVPACALHTQCPVPLLPTPVLHTPPLPQCGVCPSYSHSLPCLRTCVPCTQGWLPVCPTPMPYPLCVHTPSAARGLAAGQITSSRCKVAVCPTHHAASSRPSPYPLRPLHRRSQPLLMLIAVSYPTTIHRGPVSTTETVVVGRATRTVRRLGAMTMVASWFKHGLAPHGSPAMGTATRMVRSPALRSRR